MTTAPQNSSIEFVRQEMVDEMPAPISQIGIVAWIRKNFFSSWFNGILTVFALYLVAAWLPKILQFMVFDAVWTGTDRTVCTTEQQGGIQPDGWFGACWAYVAAYGDQFVYGRYPTEERWRVNIVFVLFFASLIPLLMPKAPYKGLNITFMTVIFPVMAFVLLTGGHLNYEGFLLPESIMAPSLGKFIVDYLILTAIFSGIALMIARGTESNPKPAIVTVLALMGALAVVLFVMGIDFGLEPVITSVWGGFLVTMVIAVTGIAASLPIGILLALGRRSELPIVRMFSIIFIEFWRGVPLVTVLFMSSVMLPLFLPEGVSFDKLLRALIGVTLFASAYMAEVVRGGLQAIPKGQYEGAMALGLSFWQMMRKIILPQALKMVIPGIVNTFIGLFKDTTLVLIIGLFDFLGMIQNSFTDPSWASPVQSISAYLFAATIYFIFCFGMSLYSRDMERRLDTGHKS